MISILQTSNILLMTTPPFRQKSLQKCLFFSIERLFYRQFDVSLTLYIDIPLNSKADYSS